MTRKILIVEDEAELVQVLRDDLERAGFLVETAGDGERALSAFHHGRPDLVLLDLNLPGMDGLDVARAIRRHSEVPIIMLTAHARQAGGSGLGLAIARQLIEAQGGSLRASNRAEGGACFRIGLPLAKD